jgi:hypothetical protein
LYVVYTTASFLFSFFFFFKLPFLYLQIESASVRGLHFVPDDAASDYYEAIMAASEADPNLDYRESVDVSELERIAEEASVGSGSVMSFIDWDEVKKLVGSDVAT